MNAAYFEGLSNEWRAIIDETTDDLDIVTLVEIWEACLLNKLDLVVVHQLAIPEVLRQLRRRYELAELEDGQ